MIPKNQHLSAKRVDYLFKKGVKSSNNYFIVKHLTTTQLASRFCVVVSVTLAPKAVPRNRLRRQIYEIIRLQKGTFKKSFDLMMIAKPVLLQLKTQEELTKAVLLTLRPFLT